MAHEVSFPGNKRFVVNDANNIASPNIVIPGLAESVPVTSDLTVEQVNNTTFPSGG